MTHPNCYVDCKDTKINSQNNYSHEKYFLHRIIFHKLTQIN